MSNLLIYKIIGMLIDILICCSYVVNEYVKSVRELACEILDLVGEGLWLPNKSVFSNLIEDVQSDSVLRINYYPAVKHTEDWELSSKSHLSTNKIGFGEHSDPQILTILRSNDVDGLQISLQDGLWVPVCPDPSAFYVLIGDAFQVYKSMLLLSFFLLLLSLKLATQFNSIYAKVSDIVQYIVINVYYIL